MGFGPRRVFSHCWPQCRGTSVGYLPSYSQKNGRYVPNEKVSDQQTVPLVSQKLTRQDGEEHSGSHCYSGKAKSMTYSECASVALGIQHTMHVRHIVFCGLSGSIIFFHIASYTA
jgi:hypothetical protein